MKISNKIIKLRNENGLSQAELARRCGMTSAAISLIEREDRNVTHKSLIALSKALNVNIEEFSNNTLSQNDKDKFFRKFGIISKLHNNDQDLILKMAYRFFED